LKSWRISEISESRPWNIFGSEGSIEIEVELEITVSNWLLDESNHYLLWDPE
jgi:hypothetical protein